VKLRLPHIFNLRRDPFERADFNSNVYWDWAINHVPQLYECQGLVAGMLENFVKYPPRQKAASFNLDAVLAQLNHGAQTAHESAPKAEAAKAPSGGGLSTKEPPVPVLAKGD
jgi:arylsulfatase